MAKNRVYYIRKNSTSQIPSNLMFLDTETKGEKVGDVDVHRMYLAWTWRVSVDAEGRIEREKWRDFTEPEELYNYVNAEARNKAPLCVIGSNITFDIFASGILEYMERDGWRCESLYDKGLVTILICKLDGRKVKFLAAQNWLQGSVKAWGELLGLEKMEVDFDEDDEQAVSTYCKRDTEITGRTVLSYLEFVRIHDMGGFSYTAAGQAFRCYRHRFMKERSILHYDKPAHNSFMRSSYFGGRVEAGVIGSLSGSFVKLDINSMYPFVMRRFTYPAKFRQWSRDCSISTLGQRLQNLCCIAEVEIETDEPAYPIPRDGKLLFPTGNFTATLCTDSLRYALSKGHIKHVKQLMTFEPARLFTEYVDYFYPLKTKYKEEGNGVWEKTVKIMLNALYGKFGEKRSREIIREHIPYIETTRNIGLYSVDALEEDHPEFDWRGEAAVSDYDELVAGVEWSLLHTRVTEVSFDEGPGSAPAIASHVTDYARMLLYNYMQKVGLDRVIYCDTDSLIVRAEDVYKLEGVIDETALGQLKVEGVADSVTIRGPKDYSFGSDLRRKGIRSNAVRVCRRCRESVGEVGRLCANCGDHLDVAAFQQAIFSGFYTLIRRGLLGGFPIGTITKSLTSKYSKGVLAADGTVSPHKLREGS